MLMYCYLNKKNENNGSTIKKDFNPWHITLQKIEWGEMQKIRYTTWIPTIHCSNNSNPFKTCYRVSHSAMTKVIWIWQIGKCKLGFVWRSFWNSQIGGFLKLQPVLMKNLLRVTSICNLFLLNLFLIYHSSIEDA